MFVSQRKLRAPEQVRSLIESVLRGEPVPSVLLSEDDDGTIQIEDGHHRVTAYRLSGRRELERYEYELMPRERRRPRFGRIDDLIGRIRWLPHA